MINIEIILILFTAIILVMVGFLAFRISMIKRRQLINFLAKPKEFEKDVKLFLTANILILFSLTVQYIYAVSVTLYFPSWFMALYSPFSVIAVLLLVYVFWRWYSRAKVMK